MLAKKMMEEKRDDRRDALDATISDEGGWILEETNREFLFRLDRGEICSACGEDCDPIIDFLESLQWCRHCWAEKSLYDEE